MPALVDDKYAWFEAVFDDRAGVCEDALFGRIVSEFHPGIVLSGREEFERRNLAGEWKMRLRRGKISVAKARAGFDKLDLITLKSHFAAVDTDGKWLIAPYIAPLRRQIEGHCLVRRVFPEIARVALCLLRERHQRTVVD